MSHTAAFEPKVIRNYPRSLSTNVPAKTVVTIDFSTDLDRDYLDPYVQLFTPEGTRISGVLTYDERTITFTPEKPFPSNATIKVLLIGDDLSGKGQGIRSVLGEYMRGNFMFTFSTEAVPQLPAPVLKFPTNQSVINKEPAFSWEPVADAMHYQLEVSTSNTMIPVFWPAREAEHVVFDSIDPMNPDISFPDGTYYWRMRAVAPDGTVGEWSLLAQFNKDTQVEGTVAIGDNPETPFVDTEYDEPEEVLAVFPQDKFSNVATNLKTVYVHVLGTYTTEEVQGTFTISGTRIDEDESDPSVVHGLITPTSVTAIPQDDGTTIIAVELPPVEEVI